MAYFQNLYHNFSATENNSAAHKGRKIKHQILAENMSSQYQKWPIKVVTFLCCTTQAQLVSSMLRIAPLKPQESTHTTIGKDKDKYARAYLCVHTHTHTHLHGMRQVAKSISCRFDAVVVGVGVGE